MATSRLITKFITVILGIAVTHFLANAQDNKIGSAVSGKKDNVLIAYFTLPETDGIDAVSGAKQDVLTWLNTIGMTNK